MNLYVYFHRYINRIEAHMLIVCGQIITLDTTIAAENHQELIETLEAIWPDWTDGGRNSAVVRL